MKGYSMQHWSKATSFAGLTFPAVCVLAAASLSATIAMAEIPDEIAVPGEIPATALHAEGAQIYECEANPDNKLAWQLREPEAALILDGNTVGRHYASLHWEHVDATALLWVHNDGSSVKAKVVARVAGVTPNDIPWLKFHVVSQNGNGAFYGVTSVQRINTQGGMVEGACDRAGSYLSVPYSADYVFWRVD
jgi:Protein of unknown function (DUF3455)